MEKNAPTDDPKDSDTLLEQEPATSKFWSLKQSPEDKKRWKQLGIAFLVLLIGALGERKFVPWLMGLLKPWIYEMRGISQ